MSTFWNSAGAQVNRAKLAQQVVPTIAANMVRGVLLGFGYSYVSGYTFVGRSDREPPPPGRTKPPPAPGNAHTHNASNPPDHQGYLAGTGMVFKGGEALMETWTGKEGEAVNSAFGAFVGHSLA